MPTQRQRHTFTSGSVYNTSSTHDVTGSRANINYRTKLVSGPQAGEHAWLIQSYAWEIQRLCPEDMDNQVSHEDLVSQPLSSNRSPVWRLGSFVWRQPCSPWELQYEGALMQLLLGCSFRQLRIKFNAKQMTAAATNE